MSLQYRTDLVPIVQSADVKQSQANYVYVMPDYHNPKLGHPVFLEITPAPDIKYKIVPSTSKGMNVLGIVIFSATMGKITTELMMSPETFHNPNFLQSNNNHSLLSLFLLSAIKYKLRLCRSNQYFIHYMINQSGLLDYKKNSY